MKRKCVMEWLRGKLIYGRRLGIFYRLWKRTEERRVQSLRRVSNPLKKSTPVFLIGCGRSGTNMLTRSLNKSFQVDLFNEDNPAAFENWRIKDLDQISKLIHSTYAKIKIFKPILDTHLAGEYISKFGNSKVIFIFRNYYDVINSSVKLFGPDNWPDRVRDWVENDFSEFNAAPPSDRLKESLVSMWHFELSAYGCIALYWYFYNSLYFDLELDHSDRVMLVNYENIALHKKSELRRICRFLRITYFPGMAKDIHASSIHRDPPPSIETSIQAACDKLWEKLHRIAGSSV
jgi:hypothetical protein